MRRILTVSLLLDMLLFLSYICKPAIFAPYKLKYRIHIFSLHLLLNDIISIIANDTYPCSYAACLTCDEDCFCAGNVRLVYTKILEVHLFAFAYRLFHKDSWHNIDLYRSTGMPL